MGARWIGLAEETTYKEGVSTPTLSMRYLELDLQPDQGRILELESAYRDKEFSLLGPFIGSGRISAWARPDELGYFLKWACGTVTSTQIGSSEMYTHTFELADTIKSFTLTDNRGLSGVQSRECDGCLIKSLTIEAPARGVVSMEAEIQYAWEKLITEPTMGTLSNLRPFMFYDASVTLEGEPVGTVESLRFVWSNDIPDDTHTLGSRSLPDIELQGVEITIEMDLKFKNWAMRQKFYGGTGSDTEPGTEEYTCAFVATFTGEPTEVADKPNYELVLNFPKVVVRENASSVSRRDRLTERVTLEALRDANNKIELSNKVVSY